MKIYIWGTGSYGKKIIDCNININDVTAFVDNDKNKKEFLGKEVIQPECLLQKDFDCIIVATAYSKDIYNQCKKIGIDLNKLIFIHENYQLNDLNQNYSLIEQVLGIEYAQKLKKVVSSEKYVIPKSHTFDSTYALKAAYKNENHFNNDYVRIKTFEMIAYEINHNNIFGETAEVGVFKGSFAQYINYLFPKKKLYLFDTFEGFDENEASSEMNSGHCDNAFINTFKNTNEEIVMKKMNYPEKVVIKKGFFPQSLDGLEEKFAFVSLDVDFEESMLECLRYFYPRLSNGGYIFIHDYNYCDELNLKGVRCAVERYEVEIGEHLHKVPICDQGGTLIISK